MEVLVTSWQEAVEHSKNWNPTKILTVMDGEVGGFDPSITRKQIEMLDFEKLDPNLSYNENHLPSQKIVQEIVDFADSLTLSDRVIIHCYAGISRSTAAALIIAYRITKDIDMSAKFIGNARPIASPNRWLCYEADKYFNHHLPYLFMVSNDKRYFPNLVPDLSNHKRHP